jgi:RNA recognition motif-containing protein
MRIYCGNLSYNVNEEDLLAAFKIYGVVESVELIKDRITGRSKGFAFIEMPTENEAQAAIEGLNEKEIKGRPLKVANALVHERTHKHGSRFKGGKVDQNRDKHLHGLGKGGLGGPKRSGHRGDR